MKLQINFSHIFGSLFHIYHHFQMQSISDGLTFFSTLFGCNRYIKLKVPLTLIFDIPHSCLIVINKQYIPPYVCKTKGGSRLSPPCRPKFRVYPPPVKTQVKTPIPPLSNPRSRHIPPSQRRQNFSARKILG